MLEAIPSPWLVPFDGSFRVAAARTDPPPDAPGKGQCRRRLEELNGEIDRLQRILFADNRWAVLLIFQALDAAGKDGTIRAVLAGIDPMGCQVHSFKQPSLEELDHDFLWRTTVRLPERGRLGIFNRSYYEEVLVVRVHPEFLGAQRLPCRSSLDGIWAERFESIRDHELHLARSGIVVVKFWLHISKAEQRRRFLERIDEPDKHWKFAPADVRERSLWDEYMIAYEQALRATSRPWAPWYAIPADDKPYMRMCVAEITVGTLSSLGLEYPRVDGAGRARMDEIRTILEAEDARS
jgi:PPK2 family polyphosphate:nucleotide phosphotransferase